MKSIRSLRILALVAAAAATAGCGKVVMSDPPKGGQTTVDHTPSAIVYMPSGAATTMPWFVLSPMDGSKEASPTAAVVRYTGLLRGTGGVLPGASPRTEAYDIFTGTLRFEHMTGSSDYLLLTGRADLTQANSTTMPFVTLPGGLRRGLLKDVKLLEEKTAAEARTAIPSALKEAMKGVDLSFLTRPLFPAFYDTDKVTHGVKVETIRYISVSPAGRPIEVSALLAYPSDLSKAQAAPVMVSYQHYTDGGRKSTSDSADVRAIAMAYAARGAVFVAADTVGIGASSDLPPSYLLWANAANTYYDGLLAANRRLHNDQRIGDPLTRLHLVGYSKGGFGTVALAETLENLYGTPPEKVYFGAAPLDLPRTFDAYLKLTTQRDVSGNKFASKLEPAALEAYIKEGVLPSWGALLPEQISAGRLYAADGKLIPAFVDHYLAATDEDNIGLKSFMEASSFSERTTFLSRFPLSKSKVRVFHYAGDPLVPAENTEAFMRLAAAKGVSSVARGDCGESRAEFASLMGLAGFAKPVVRANAVHALCGFSMLNASLSDL